ncbi:MAG TPA: hypothetical protein VKZ71_00875 [Burkholderiaceae bacterium]|nr:hypothetical protein [Burkholderiaceae bacterium]
MENMNDPQAVIDAANALIEKVQQGQDDIDAFYRAENLDPEKVNHILEQSMTDEIRAKAQQEFDADMEAVEREVAEEAARRSFQNSSTPPSGSPDINMMV